MNPCCKHWFDSHEQYILKHECFPLFRGSHCDIWRVIVPLPSSWSAFNLTAGFSKYLQCSCDVTFPTAFSCNISKICIYMEIN